MAFIELNNIYGTTDPVPYVAGDSANLQTVQSGDTLFIVHPDHQPATLKRYSDVDWRYELFDIKNGPYRTRAPGDELTTLALTDIVDRVVLKSTVAAFAGIAVNDYIEYPLEDKKVIGIVKSIDNSKQITVEPLEDRCYEPDAEVYSPGLHDGKTGGGDLKWKALTYGTSVNVGFSHVGVVTKSLIGNYLRFPYQSSIQWMQVDSINHTENQTGRFAQGVVLTVKKPSAAVARERRTITATMTSSSSGFFDTDRDIGRWFRLSFGTESVFAQCYDHGSNSDTQFKVNLNRQPPYSLELTQQIQDNATNDWYQGAFYKGNWPATITFHQGRLCFGGTYDEPQTLWMSKVEDYDNFSPVEDGNEVNDDSAITLTLNSATTNEICWMVSKSSLLVGTSGANWQIGASSNREAITPTNVKADLQTNDGSEYLQAITAARSVLFLQGGGRKLRELVYNYAVDQFDANDLCIFAEHILKDHENGKMIAYQQLPDSTVYVVCNDGQVAVLVYEPEQKVYAWSRYIIGGPESVVNSAAIRAVGDNHQVYLNVTRNVNGVEKTTLEVLNTEFRPSSSADRSDMIFMDGWQSIPLGNIAGTVLTDDNALSLYRGQTVNLLIDNRVYTSVTVPLTGSLTIPVAPVTRCIIGYPYKSVVQTLPLEYPSQSGTVQGKIKRVSQIVFRLMDTLSFDYGDSEGNVGPCNPNDYGQTEDPDAPYFSGDIRVPAPHGFERSGAIRVESSRPTPITILAIYPEVS